MENIIQKDVINFLSKKLFELDIREFRLFKKIFFKIFKFKHR